MVGEWISIRRDELGITKTDMAKLVGADVTSVSNAESGKHEIKRNRAKWEDALKWERGDLTRAYRHGEEPRPTSDKADVKRMSGPELIDHVKELRDQLPEDDEVLRRTAELLLAMVVERLEAAQRERGAS